MILIIILFAAIAIYFARLARKRGEQLKREQWRIESLLNFIGGHGARTLTNAQASRLIDAIKQHGKPSPAAWVDDPTSLLGSKEVAE